MKNKSGFTVFKFIKFCASIIGYIAYERAKDFLTEKLTPKNKERGIPTDGTWIMVSNSGLNVSDETARRVQKEVDKTFKFWLEMKKLKQIVTCGDTVYDYSEECCLYQELVECGGEVPESNEIVCSVDSCGVDSPLECGFWNVNCERNTQD